MKNKRKYVKKDSSYWNNLSKANVKNQQIDFEPELVGFGSYYPTSGGHGSVRSSRSSKSIKPLYDNSYKYLETLSTPFNYGERGVEIKDPIMLCQKAYFHIPIFRHTIDILSELSDSDIVLQGGSKEAKNFVKKWIESAKINKLKNQYFREYFRSGNIFIYRMFSSFSEEEMTSIKKAYGKNSELIPQESGFPKRSLPLKYVLLNPIDIVNYEAIGGSNVYKKVLSKFEVIRLKNPSTEEEKRIYKKIGDEILHENTNEIYLDLEPDRLIFSFYKKQDYEPFSVPFGFPVLKDINWKMELKKIDQSLSRSLENAILLITMGDEPSKGGINPKNIEAMKRLFSSESVGRILVADYTTKAQFVVPDLQRILTKEKYEIVNQDIKEGLMDIFFEDSKFSNAEVKIKIFYEKIKEARRTFIEDFLQPEIKKICYQVGFRDFPKARFRSSNILNEADTQKAAIRLMELGVLHPTQGIQSISDKELPDPQELKDIQKKFVEERKEGLYSPLVGGPPLYRPEEEQQSSSPIQNLPAEQMGRPPKDSIAKNIDSLVSVKAISQTAKKASEFESFAKKHMAKKIKGDLSSEQEKAVEEVCRSIIESSEIENWQKSFKECVSSVQSIDKLNVKKEIVKISEDFELPVYEASLIYHSKKI